MAWVNRTSSLDRTACKLVLTYGGNASIVAYTKAVYCESNGRLLEAKQWRGVLGRVAAINAALNPDFNSMRRLQATPQ